MSRHVIAVLLLLALPAAAQSPLGPQARSYYYQNGPVVRLYDGGTGSRNAYDARLALAVPWKWGPDSISAGWIMSGSLITPYTIVNDTLARFVASFDTTRKAQLDASLISTATTRKFQFPNKAGTFAMTSDVSGLLASNNVWTGTNVYSNDVTVGGGHVFALLSANGIDETDLTSDASGTANNVHFANAAGTVLIHSATQPVGSKTLYTTNTINARDDRFTLKASGDTTKTLAVNLSLLTAARIDSMPDVSGRRVMSIARRPFTSQSANIGSTAITGTLAAGDYRVMVYGVSASLMTSTVTVTLAWTDPVQAQTKTALTIAAAVGSESDGVSYLRVASGSISLSTTGYLTGSYSLYVTVEAL